MSYSERSGSATFRPWQGSPAGDGRASSMVIYGGGGKTTDSDVYRVGIYGWRKRCLYFLILLLIAVIITNLALTIWIMRVLDFNTSGMGSLKILKDGVRITGRSEFDRPVTFNKMTVADNNTPFLVQSSSGIGLNARVGETNSSCALIMEGGKLKTMCKHFAVESSDGTPLFYANKDEVAIQVDNFRIISQAGSKFDGSVQTSLIRPEAGHPLSLESPTRGLNATATQDIEIVSRSGDVKVEALHNVQLESVLGEIRFNTPNIYVSRIMQATATESGRGVGQYQACLCTNGRLFLAHPGVDCRSSPETCR